MKKQEVLNELCQLSQKVMEEVFRSQVSADCFCDKGECDSFSPEVMAYIQTAVWRKIGEDLSNTVLHPDKPVEGTAIAILVKGKEIVFTAHYTDEQMADRNLMVEPEGMKWLRRMPHGT